QPCLDCQTVHERSERQREARSGGEARSGREEQEQLFCRHSRIWFAESSGMDSSGVSRSYPDKSVNGQNGGAVLLRDVAPVCSVYRNLLLATAIGPTASRSGDLCCASTA